MISELEILKDAKLRTALEKELQRAAIENPHLDTNPVRTIEDWCAYVERFARRMPWQTMDIGEDASFFRRIDQNIGYFYFLLGDLQYEPRVAQWLKAYNIAWGEWLSSPESWNDEYYQLALSDPLFELASGRYESRDNWHSWNDFFARRLNNTLHITPYTFIAPCDGEITPSRRQRYPTGSICSAIVPIARCLPAARQCISCSMSLITIASICRVMVRCSNAKPFKASTPEEASSSGMRSKAAIAMTNAA